MRRFNMNRQGEVVVLTFVDRKILDIDNISEIGIELRQLFEQGGCSNIVLNFVRVEYFSSPCYGALIMAAKLALANGGKLVICNVSADIRRDFERIFPDQLFQICNTEGDAIAQFS